MKIAELLKEKTTTGARFKLPDGVTPDMCKFMPGDLIKIKRMPPYVDYKGIYLTKKMKKLSHKKGKVTGIVTDLQGQIMYKINVDNSKHWWPSGLLERRNKDD